MHWMFLGVFVCFFISHAEANCPRCAKIEAERTAHPTPEVGYYETPPQTPESDPAESEKPHDS